MRWLRQRAWSPYVAGALIGVLSWFSFATADEPLGVSTAIVQTVAFAERMIVPAHVQQNQYFAKIPQVVNWGWVLVVGLMLGAFVSSRLSGEEGGEKVPLVWRERFGNGVKKRYFGALLGGLLTIFGAKMAGGCTSGHGISGSLQLAVSGWTFFLSLFVSGVVTALVLYGKGDRDV